MRAVLSLTLLAVAGGMVVTAVAADGDPPIDDDAAALSLPFTEQAESSGKRALSLTTEGAVTAASQRTGGTAEAQRLSFDLRYDNTIAPNLRAVFADLLDLEWAHSFDNGQEINTLKEGYLDWRPGSNLLLDAGRINVREGVALGYNPTDFLRAGALRTVDSLDPNSLRQNRLGTVMLREQTLWDSGSLTTLVAPRLPVEPALGSSAGAGPFNPDFGATNSKDRWMLDVSQRIRSDWTPQLLIFGADGSLPQLGLNLTCVLGSSVVAYVETSAGRQASLWAQAGNSAADTAWRSRAATGFTYSTDYKLSLTLEYEYNGAALSRGGWAAARQDNPADYGRYRALVSTEQDLVTQHSAFVYASWQDLLVRHLDLSAFVRADLVDHSWLPWAELRHHWSHVDVAVRWQNYVGRSTSDFGASPSGSTWQAVLDYYL